jgi:translation initiation factor IF-3
MVGVVSVDEGMRAAEAAGLDLVEISPNAEPPVCKVLDYGKYKYEQQKKAAEARKNQKIVDTKEIKLRPTIEDHDYEVKKRNARRFLEEGDKVKVSLRFRGREMAHKDIADALMERFKKDLEDIGKIEMHPRLEGRQMIMILTSEK